MADASYRKSVFHIERYQEKVRAMAHEIIARFDALLAEEKDGEKRMELKTAANEEVAVMAKKETLATLDKVLFELSNQMKNAYSRSDA